MSASSLKLAAICALFGLATAGGGNCKNVCTSSYDKHFLPCIGKSACVAAKKACELSRVSFMPDHVHAAMRANAALSPEEIALAFQNNLAYVLGQRRVWEDTYYVGTFGEYDLKVVRGRSSGG